MNKYIKLFSAVGIVFLSSACYFFITKYANDILIEQFNNLSHFYNIFSNISSLMGALIPIIVFLFLYETTQIMVNIIFEFHIEKAEIFFITGISFSPFLVFQYFLWYNLIVFTNSSVISNAEDFYDIKYIFGLSFYDLNFIGTICWVLLFSIMIVMVHKKMKSILKAIVSALTPSLMVIVSMRILSMVS